MPQLTRLENESELQCLWRIGLEKDSGLLDENWDAIADFMNKEFKNEDEKITSCTYRKKFRAAKDFYDEVLSKINNDDTYNKYKEEERKLFELKTQYRDERNSWNKQNYIVARLEENFKCLEEKLLKLNKLEFTDYSSTKPIKGNNDLLVCASDWHIGETFSNNLGCYNSTIAKERINKLVGEIVNIGRTHNSENVYVALLGDLISGSIHFALQVSNQENVIEQIELAVEYIFNFCVELSKYFSKVYIVGCSGNHSRLTPNKKQDIKDERLDSLIIWIVEKLVSDINNIELIDNANIDNSIAKFSIRGLTYLGVHGDYDYMDQNSIGKICTMLGTIPYTIVGGHRHTPAYQEFNNIKYIQSGSLSGTGNDYTLQKRLSGKPNQTILVCNNKGINAIYNVEL